MKAISRYRYERATKQGIILHLRTTTTPADVRPGTTVGRASRLLRLTLAALRPSSAGASLAACAFFMEWCSVRRVLALKQRQARQRDGTLLLEDIPVVTADTQVKDGMALGSRGMACWERAGHSRGVRRQRVETEDMDRTMKRVMRIHRSMRRPQTMQSIT